MVSHQQTVLVVFTWTLLAATSFFATTPFLASRYFMYIYDGAIDQHSYKVDFGAV